MADPYANTIWIDSSYWFWTLLGLAFCINCFFWWAGSAESQKYGPADQMVRGIGQIIAAAFLSAVIMFSALWVLQQFGIDIGMSG